MSRRTEKLEALFEAALVLESDAQRQAYLDRACPDPDVRHEVESLLAAHRNPDSLLVPGREGAGTVVTVPITEQPGDLIGRYKLLEKLGDGGFGVVYMAEQREPVKRRVALKIIKVGMDTREVVARFEVERQALALMDHPNIAKVFDAGCTERTLTPSLSPVGGEGSRLVRRSSESEGGRAGEGDANSQPLTSNSQLAAGRPYFVMELVRGIRITDYCDQNQLGLKERLKLFMQVCHAVQHAHQKGIIHRDLKPSNILVTLHDGVPVPKVIDFGIAKATQQELTEKTLFTQFHQFIGTPSYMSPEQAELSGLDIDTRSDIYTLGVLLYELLAGKPPFDGQALLMAGLDEMRRTIREKEPIKPSTRLKQERAATTSAGSGKSEIRNPRSEIDKDLDWIVMKCLEKDRTRRYETANGLATDLQRHLSNEPVMARPPSVMYRLRKAAMRNKVGFTAAAGVAVTMIAAIMVSSWQAARAERERVSAEGRLRASLEFIDLVFDSVSPDVNALIGGGSANRKLAAGGLKLMEEFRKDADSLSPDFRLALAQLQTQVGFTQSWPVGNTTGDYEGGLKSATEAISLLQPSADEPLGDTRMGRLARAEMVAGYASLALRRNEEALSHFRRMELWATRVALSKDRSWAGEGRTFKQWANLCIGEVLMQMGPANVQRAIDEQFLPQLRMLREDMGSNSTPSLYVLAGLHGVSDSLGIAHSKLGRWNDALAHFREALRLIHLRAARRPNNADDAQQVVEAGAKLGETLLNLGESEEGARLLDASLEQAEALVKRDRANTGFAQLRITVLMRYALGMAARSGDFTSTAAERNEHLKKAQVFLDRAEALLPKVPTESLKNWLRPDLELARAKVAAAKSKLEDVSAPNRSQEREAAP